MDIYQEIPFNFNLIEELTTQGKWENIALYLKETFRVQHIENGNFKRFVYSKGIIDKLHYLMLVPLEKSLDDPGLTIMLEESIKALRNYATTENVQEYICKENFFNTFSKITDLFIESSSTQLAPSFRFILQLIINMLTNIKLVKNVHQMFFAKSYEYYFKENIPLYETSALLYNFVKNEPLTDDKLIVRTVELYKDNHSIEYLQFFMDKIISEEHFWKNYEIYDFHVRLILLQDLRESELQKESDVHKDGLKKIIAVFLKSPSTIFQVTSNRDTENAFLEASKVVEVISTLSSNDEHLKYFQSLKDILITAGVLLINVHRLGKQNKSCFSPIQKLSEIQNPSKDIKQHPSFGFKADLVRLIGNLCWKSKEMQDLARTAELIPVLLDSCNIDARNPFIIQWAILAMHNICEDNVENQKVIADMHQVGTVPSEVIEELGFTLHAEGNHSLKIVPLESLHKNS